MTCRELTDFMSRNTLKIPSCGQRRDYGQLEVQPTNINTSTNARSDPTTASLRTLAGTALQAEAYPYRHGHLSAVGPRSRRGPLARAGHDAPTTENRSGCKALVYALGIESGTRRENGSSQARYGAIRDPPMTSGTGRVHALALGLMSISRQQWQITADAQRGPLASFSLPNHWRSLSPVLAREDFEQQMTIGRAELTRMRKRLSALSRYRHS